MHTTKVDELVIYQRELLGIVDEFFSRATGKNRTDFQSIDEIGNFFRQNSSAIAKRAEDAFPWLDGTIGPFYQKHKIRPFKLAADLSGLKLVLGGSSAFLGSQLDAVRKTLLYADTILIPDPVLPWLEVQREGENFRYPRTIQAAWALLQLKPLVDANLQYPAVLIFPSWEKSLEEHDATTREGILKLVTDVVSFASGRQLETFEDVSVFVKAAPDEFLRAVEQHALFVAPDGVPGEPLGTAIEKYRTFTRTWRETDHVEKLLSLPDSVIVLNGLVERLAPQFHLQENAQELKSDPLFCLPVHSHYWQLCCSLSSRRLKRLSLLDDGTLGVIASINSNQFTWLGNVPIDALVELRKNNENEDFRRHVNSQLDMFHGATVEDINKVASEVGRSIDALLVKHQHEIKKIEEKYSKLHKSTAGMSWATAAAMYAPALAPYVGLSAPLALIVKYGWNKLNEREERQKAGRSLMGVLAYAQEKGATQ